MSRYAIGLGSNLGDRLAHMRAGAAGISALGSTSYSAIYETEPIGGPEQGPYLNAIAVLESEASPGELLQELHQIEAAQKRERKERWGARTLDLDIISSDGPEVTESDLVIPHPRASEREFVLRPLVEIWPDAPVGGGLTAQNALSRVDHEVDFLTRQWIEPVSRWPGRVFVGIQFVWFVAIALALAWDGSLPTGEAEPLRLVGALIAAFGAGLAFIASRRLGPAMTPFPEPNDLGQLVDSGPYRLVRHPVYGGVSLFILGTALVLDSIAGTVLSLGLFPFFLVKTLYEERMLRLRYSGYRAYREIVSRRLVPFVF